MIYGYIHIATIGEWQNILQEQINRLLHSGLYDRCEVIDLCIVGDQKIEITHAKFNVVYLSNDIESFEFPTLNRIYEHATEPGSSFYIHLKGVSKTLDHWKAHKDFYLDYAGITSFATLKRNEWLWRLYMEYFVVDRHRDCCLALSDYDLCGVHWRDEPFPHFSGNFWWSRNDYIGRLNSPRDFFAMNPDYVDAMGSRRSLAEFWIGSGKPRVKVLYNNDFNLYHKGILPYLYKKTKLF